MVAVDPEDVDPDGEDQEEGAASSSSKPRKDRTQVDLNQIWKLYNDSVEIDGMESVCPC